MTYDAKAEAMRLSDQEWVRSGYEDEAVADLWPALRSAFEAGARAQRSAMTRVLYPITWGSRHEEWPLVTPEGT